MADLKEVDWSEVCNTLHNANFFDNHKEQEKLKKSFEEYCEEEDGISYYSSYYSSYLKYLVIDIIYYT